MIRFEVIQKGVADYRIYDNQNHTWVYVSEPGKDVNVNYTSLTEAIGVLLTINPESFVSVDESE